MADLNEPAMGEIPGIFDGDKVDKLVIQQNMIDVRRAAWKGLRSLSMTNKKCNRIVARFLYITIDLHNFDPARQTDGAKLIARLLTDRNVAEIVRSLDFDCPFDWKADEVRHLNDTIVTELLGDGDLAERAWTVLGEHARHLIVLEGLLKRMKSLESLCFDPDWDIETIQQSVILPSISLKSLLPNLRCLKYYHDWGSVEAASTFGHDFLCRTRVHTFVLQNFVDLVGMSTRGMGIIPTRIRSLSLCHCLFSATALDRLLRCCPKIAYFCYIVSFNELVDSGTSVYERATAADAVRSLKQYTKNLETLHLDLTSCWYRDGHQEIPGYVLEPETVQDLSSLSSLKDLHINRFDLTPALKGDFAEISLGYGDNSRDTPAHEQNMPIQPNDFLSKLPSSLVYFRITKITKSVVQSLKQIPTLINSGRLPNLRLLDLIDEAEKCVDVAEACEGRNDLLLSHGNRYH